MGTSKSQRTILSEDGELRRIDAESDGEAASPNAGLSAVFCTHCGTANPASSRFCRTCGQALDEQVINPASLDTYAPPAWKNKRSADPEGQARHLTPQESALMLEVFTLLILGALGAVAIATQQTWIALILLVVWIVLKVSQRVGQRNQ